MSDFYGAGTTLPAPPTTILSPQQRQIMELIADGRTNLAIAARLELSEYRVIEQIKRSFELLGAVNRAHAVAQAIRAGELS